MWDFLSFKPQGNMPSVAKTQVTPACRFSNLWNHPGEEGRVQHFAQERTLETNYPHTRFTFEEMEPE